MCTMHGACRLQMLVVVAERLLSHPAEEYSRVVEFLGLR